MSRAGDPAPRTRLHLRAGARGGAGENRSRPDGIALNRAVSAWHGLDLIRHYVQPAPGEKEPRIFIGEIGLPEHGRMETDVVAWWDVAMGVLLARQIPHLFHWELYCNEPLDRKKSVETACKAEEMRGCWLIRPDGSPGFAAKYFKRLLENAGGKLA